MTEQTNGAAVPVPAGMKPWHGGDNAPADWNPKGDVKWATPPGYEARGPKMPEQPWKHSSVGWYDIIAYTPLPATQPGDGEVTQGVIQADRIAFAKLDDYEPGSMGWQMIVDRKSCDNSVGVQAFARHRLAHADTQTAALRAERDALREALIAMPVDADYANADAFRDAVNAWWDETAPALTGEREA